MVWEGCVLNVREWITYLGEVILITAVSGLFYHIAPEGSMKKYLHFVISLCVLVALAVPMFSMVMELPEIFEEGFEEVKGKEELTNGNLEEALISASQREIEAGIASYISEIHGIAPEDITVEIFLNAEDREAIEIRRIRVVLRGQEQAQAEEIRRALHEMFLGKSEVTVSVQSREE